MLASSLGPSGSRQSDVDRDLREVEMSPTGNRPAPEIPRPSGNDEFALPSEGEDRVPAPTLDHPNHSTSASDGLLVCRWRARRQSMSSLSRSAAPERRRNRPDAERRNGHPTTRNPHRPDAPAATFATTRPTPSAAQRAGSANSLLLTSARSRGSCRTNCRERRVSSSTVIPATRLSASQNARRATILQDLVMDAVATSASRTPCRLTTSPPLNPDSHARQGTRTSVPALTRVVASLECLTCSWTPSVLGHPGIDRSRRAAAAALRQ